MWRIDYFKPRGYLSFVINFCCEQCGAGIEKDKVVRENSSWMSSKMDKADVAEAMVGRDS